MTAAEKDRALWKSIVDAMPPAHTVTHGPVNLAEARTLRRAQLTLHRWAEEMCNGTIQRHEDEQDKPFRHYQDGHTNERSYPIPDREAGALRRVEQVCKDCGLHYYHNTDPRGCALWVATFPLDQSNYNQGIACL